MRGENMRNRILVVEDDAAIAEAIGLNLMLPGYDYTILNEAEASAYLLKDHKFDLALLDIMLPHSNGFSLIDSMSQYNIPVLYLTAKSDLASKIKGLRLGPEDCIVKPFEMLELLMRIDQILARTGKLDNILRYKSITVDTVKRTVQQSGIPVKLQPLEFDLLVILMRFKNCTLSRERILNEVWGFEFAGGTRTVDIHVSHLRKKLSPELNIVAITKIGYRLED